MDKIICDVCGTSYPEMAEQCPICGYAKPAMPVKKPDGESEGRYQHVKGGRFSSANVRRRNEEKGIPVQPEPPEEDERPAKKGSNLVLGIIAIILLLALIAVLLWFIIDIVGERLALMDTIPTQTTQQEMELQLQPSVIELDAEGAVAIIQASVVPVDAEAFYLFESEDPSVATVDEFGTVTAIAEGETSIIVTYGQLQKKVSVVCAFTKPTETTAPKDPFTFNRSDFTLNAQGEKWDLCGKDVTIAKNQITWTSEDESVAKIEGGIVEAVGPGVTKVHGQYEDFTASCVVRCKFEVESTESTDATEAAGGTFKISHTDVTIAVGESFLLQLRDENKKAVEVSWAVSEDGFITIEGNKITGAKATATKGVIVSVTYEGKTYQCTVRVKKG